MNKSALAAWTINIIILACALIILGAFASRYSLMEKARGDLEVKLVTTLSNTVESYQIWTTGQTTNIQQWPRDIRFRTHLMTLLEVERSSDSLASHSEQLVIRDLMRGWLTDHGYQGYFIIAPDGTNLGSTRDSNLGLVNIVKLQKPHLFDRVLAGQSLVTPPLVSDLEITVSVGGATGQASTMFAMTPVFGDSGQVIAIFTVRLNPAGGFSGVFQSGHLGLSGETYAFDEHGRILSESRFDLQLREMGLLGDNEMSSLNIEIRDPGVDLRSGAEAEQQRSEQPFTLMARRALAGNSGTNLDGYNDYRGVQVVGTWIWDANRKIGVTTEIDVQEAYSNVSAALNTLYLFAGVCIFILLAALYISVWIRRKFAEAALKIEQKQRDLQLILDAAGEGVCGIDSVGRVSFLNPKGCEILGYSELDLIGMPMHETVHHSYSDGKPYPIKECQMLAAVSDGKVHHVENEVFWRKNGLPVPVSYTSTPMWDDGVLGGAVITFRDITQELAANKALEHAKEIAVAASKAKSTFLSSMSHELRTPLNAVLGYGQILQNQPQDMTGQQKEFLDGIVSSGSHLLNLIDDVLELSKIEAGEMTLSLEEVRIEDAIEDSISMVSMQAMRAGVTIVDASKGKMLPNVYSDFLRVKQVFINLLSNAVKYNRPDGKVTIDVDRKDNNNVRVTISDTGIGIPEERLGELWVPFNRVGAETTHVEGTGIGLSVTKQVIDLLGGKIGVESTVGKGSVFWFELPIAHGFSAEGHDRRARWNGALSSDDKNLDFSDFKGMKLLYVEDTISNQQVIKGIFGAETCVDICLATTAREGLEKMSDFKPDVILLDINLPDFDGLVLKAHLQNMPDANDIPVIALSANITPATQEKAEKLGFADFLSKPVHIASLYKSLARLV